MKTKKIVILGCNGQVGYALSRNLDPIHNIYAFSKEIADITDREQLRDVCKLIMPDIIINCAAIVDLKKANDDPKSAMMVNSLGAMNVSHIALELNARLIYFSTDYVFDGFKHKPYVEEDITNPINIYGQSKEWGEKLIQLNMENYVILRTSWVYGGEMGTNFYTRLMNNYEKSNTIRVVSDEISSPTYVETITECVEKVIMNDDIKGVYHVCDKGYTSRYEYAKKVFSLLNKPVEIIPCKSEEMNGNITRPLYTPLDTNKFENDFNYIFKSWEERLEEFVKR